MREGPAAPASFDWEQCCLLCVFNVNVGVCVNISVYVPREHWRRMCSMAVLYFPGHHSWSNHHNICHSKAYITLTTSRLRAISSRMQCCCHSWFSFL